MNIDFTFLYKNRIEDFSALKNKNYKIFISTYSEAERVLNVIRSLIGEKNIILVLPNHEIPSIEGCSFLRCEYNIDKFFNLISSISIAPSDKICIDITGFLIPHFMIFLKYIQKIGIKKVDIIYSEPAKYKNAENTIFSEEFEEVRTIPGYAGNISYRTNNDLLIIASGYDYSSIIQIANSKIHAKKIQLFGFPPLQADMYQENILMASRAEDVIGSDSFIHLEGNLFASANDPFEVSQQLYLYISKEHKRKNFTNIYLAPLSTKPHALGIALLYLYYEKKFPINVIYPFSKKTNLDNSMGISRTWQYEVLLP